MYAKRKETEHVEQIEDKLSPQGINSNVHITYRIIGI